MMYKVSSYLQSISGYDRCQHQLICLVILISGTGQPSAILLAHVVADSPTLDLPLDSVTVDADYKATPVTDPVSVEERCVAYIAHLTDSLHGTFPCSLVI